MYKYLYVSLICGLLAGAGIFLKIPIFPSFFLPVIIGAIGIIATLITLLYYEISVFFQLNYVLIILIPITSELHLL
ncbi:hypothetical protein BUY41_08660, partial [Staphylococcus cohnii]